MKQEFQRSWSAEGVNMSVYVDGRMCRVPVSNQVSWELGIIGSYLWIERPNIASVLK